MINSRVFKELENENLSKKIMNSMMNSSLGFVIINKNEITSDDIVLLKASDYNITSMSTNFLCVSWVEKAPRLCPARVNFTHPHNDTLYSFNVLRGDVSDAKGDLESLFNRNSRLCIISAIRNGKHNIFATSGFENYLPRKEILKCSELGYRLTTQSEALADLTQEAWDDSIISYTFTKHNNSLKHVLL